MKTLAVMLLVLVSVAAFGADAPDRPAGVEATNGIAISPTMGFVVIAAKPEPPVVRRGAGALLVPPLAGYFMAKTAAGWQRLIVVEPLKGPGATG
jgi:hypothetical protein